MLKRMTSKERKFIEKNYEEMTYREIAEKLGRSVYTVRDYAWKNGLKKQKKVVSKEVQFILDNYSEMTLKEMSEKLKRPRVTIYAYLHRHGLKAKPSETNVSKLTDEVREYILEHHKEESTYQLAKHCDVSKYTMNRYLKQLGVASREVDRIENRHNRMGRDRLLKCMKEWGLTFQEIGDILGVTRQRVHQIFQQFSVDEIRED